MHFCVHFRSPTKLKFSVSTKRPCSEDVTKSSTNNEGLTSLEKSKSDSKLNQVRMSGVCSFRVHVRVKWRGSKSVCVLLMYPKWTSHRSVILLTGNIFSSILTFDDFLHIFQAAHDDEPIRRSNSNHNIIKRSPKKTKKSKSYSKLLELDKDVSTHVKDSGCRPFQYFDLFFPDNWQHWEYTVSRIYTWPGQSK